MTARDRMSAPTIVAKLAMAASEGASPVVLRRASIPCEVIAYSFLELLPQGGRPARRVRRKGSERAAFGSLVAVRGRKVERGKSGNPVIRNGLQVSRSP